MLGICERNALVPYSFRPDLKAILEILSMMNVILCGTAKVDFPKNHLPFIAPNFRAKCSFLMVLDSLQSLDTDLSGSFRILKKYSLSSEIQLVKVGHISENPGFDQNVFLIPAQFGSKSDLPNRNP